MTSVATMDILSLGGFPFEDFEIPERMPFGGTQKVIVQHYEGGGKEVQAKGPDFRPITWTGRFRGNDAVAFARSIDAMRLDGSPVELFWASFLYDVVITSFDPDFAQFYEIPYSITCEVVSDKRNSLPVQPLSASQQFQQDNSFLGNISATLSSAYQSVTSAVSDVVGPVIATVQSTAQSVVDSGVLQFAGDALAVTGSVTALTGGILSSGILGPAQAALNKATGTILQVAATSNGAIGGASIASGGAVLSAISGLVKGQAGMASGATAFQMGNRLSRMSTTLANF